MSVILYSNKIVISNSGESPLKATEFMKDHLSMPVNPDIAHIAFLRGYIDKIGRGTLKIIDACRKADIEAPSWNTTKTNVRLTFPLRNGA